MQPQPWSHSRLEAFKNCPRQFHEVQILKSVKEEKGEATLWGEQVHKHFENFLADGVDLPDVLGMHREFLERLIALPGEPHVERRIALDTSGQPCGFFDANVWYRGVIDYQKVNGSQALVIDHKTGKVHQKLGQLIIFALWTFAQYPEVQTVRAEYYWTQNRTKAGGTYSRADIPQLWALFIPDLRQYAEAFKTDTWQPRQSGLCNGWCPVTDCEFWKPKRKRS